jgi:hypothetical protein
MVLNEFNLIWLSLIMIVNKWLLRWWIIWVDDGDWIIEINISIDYNKYMYKKINNKLLWVID